MKRITILLLTVLTAAVLSFAGYQHWIHNNLDTVGPVFSVEEELLEISVNDPETALFQGIQALDDVDGDVSGTMIVENIHGIDEENVATVTYVAFDKAGNVSKISRQVRYVDYESPRFELFASLCYPSGLGDDLLSYVGAYDVLEGDIRRRIHATLVSSTGSVDKEGSHKVRFQVTNSLGDIVEVDLPVEVYNAEWYTAQVELKNYLVYLEKGTAFDARDYLKSFQVRGDPIDLLRDIPDDVSCYISGHVNTHVPGVYKVTYTLSQDVGQNTYSGISMLIVIVEE